MIEQRQHQQARPDWPFFAILAVAVCTLVALLITLYTTPETHPKDLRLEGCLEFCRSHGDHKSPRQYLDCADGCEEALRAK